MFFYLLGVLVSLILQLYYHTFLIKEEVPLREYREIVLLSAFSWITAFIAFFMILDRYNDNKNNFV